MMTKKSTLDLSYLTTMAGGDPATMKTLLKTLLAELSNNHTNARKLFQQQRWPELERFCHHFKSTVSFAGNKTLENANLQLWNIAKSEGGKASDASKILGEFERQSQMVVREINQVLKTI